MRIGKRGFAARIKGDLRLDFGRESLTSFAGLELVRRFVAGLGLVGELRQSERRLGLGGDLGFSKLVLIVVGMLVVGARRVRHLGFLGGDPLFLRFSGLGRLPTARSLSRGLERLSWRAWPELDRVGTRVVRKGLDAVEPARRWTLDIDGSVLSTGLTVERAERGYNPHHRKNPSYYPLLVTLAQTGHVIGHLNRRGNVHDSHRSSELLRQTVSKVRSELGLAGVLEARADSAFFQRDFLATCDRLGLEYAVKVPMWPWLNIRAVVQSRADGDWRWVDRKLQLQGLFAELPIAAWGRTERVALYRRRVGHQPVKGRQLELFNPDDGHWEYSVVATNKQLELRALWHFQAGRGAQEKTIAELKSGYAFDTIPSRTYRANTAWQKLSILAHNLMTSFQLSTTSTKKPRSPKRTTSYRLQTIATLRFEWLNRAGRLLRPSGAPTLRLVDNSTVRRAVENIATALAQAA